MAGSKGKQIALITTWSIIGIAAVAVMAWAASGGSILKWFASRFGGGEAVHVIGTTRITEEIRSLDIDWTSGGVKLVPSEGDEIVITEKAAEPDREQRLIQTVRDGVLEIDCKNGKRFFFFGWVQNNTVLEITLPRKQYDRIVLDATSGKYDLSGIKAGELSAKLTSGRILLDGTSSDTADIRITSGTISGTGIETGSLDVVVTSGTLDLEGRIRGIGLKMTSGNAKVRTQVTPDRLDAKVTSGNMTFWIPDTAGFSVDVHKTSGNFDTDFALSTSGDRHTFRDGGPQYNLSSTSGNIHLYTAK